MLGGCVWPLKLSVDLKRWLLHAFKLRRCSLRNHALVFVLLVHKGRFYPLHLLIVLLLYWVQVLVRVLDSNRGITGLLESPTQQVNLFGDISDLLVDSLFIKVFTEELEGRLNLDCTRWAPDAVIAENTQIVFAVGALYESILPIVLISKHPMQSLCENVFATVIKFLSLIILVLNKDRNLIFI